MKVKRARAVLAEEIIFDDEGLSYLRIVGPEKTPVEGLPIWYVVSSSGWLALGVDRFAEHEEAYQKSRAG